ncbi:hypothetical protein J437_LFUL003023, partial [Ladona fulva]
MEVDNMGMSEIRWPNKGDYWSGENWILYYKNEEGSGEIEVWGLNERGVMTKFRMEPRYIVFIQVYMLMSNYPDQQVDVYEEIEEVLMIVYQGDKLVILGDWNGVVVHNLVIGNMLLQQHKRRRCTWSMLVDGERFQIDYILVTKSFKNQIKITISCPDAYMDSGHNPVLMKSKLQLRRKKMNQKNYKLNFAKIR